LSHPDGIIDGAEFIEGRYWLGEISTDRILQLLLPSLNSKASWEAWRSL